MPPDKQVTFLGDGGYAHRGRAMGKVANQV